MNPLAALVGAPTALAILLPKPTRPLLAPLPVLVGSRAAIVPVIAVAAVVPVPTIPSVIPVAPVVSVVARNGIHLVSSRSPVIAVAITGIGRSAAGDTEQEAARDHGHRAPQPQHRHTLLGGFVFGRASISRPSTLVPHDPEALKQVASFSAEHAAPGRGMLRRV